MDISLVKLIDNRKENLFDGKMQIERNATENPLSQKTRLVFEDSANWCCPNADTPDKRLSIRNPVIYMNSRKPVFKFSSRIYTIALLFSQKLTQIRLVDTKNMKYCKTAKFYYHI